MDFDGNNLPLYCTRKAIRIKITVIKQISFSVNNVYDFLYTMSDLWFLYLYANLKLALQVKNQDKYLC